MATEKKSKEESIAAMDAAAEMFQAWAEKYPDAAKEISVIMRTFIPVAGLKRLVRIIAKLG